MRRFDGAALRAIRQDQGWTQAELAARIGRTQRSVVRYESGDDRPPLVAVEALAHVLGVSVADLFVDDGKDDPALAQLREQRAAQGLPPTLAADALDDVAPVLRRGRRGRPARRSNEGTTEATG